VNILSVEHIDFCYRSTDNGTEFSLGDISVEVKRGEFLSILGPNGSGKTTLLRIISRILRPARGTVKFDGKDFLTLSRREIAKTVGIVPQEHPIVFPFTVREIVLTGRTPYIRGLGFESDHDLDVARETMKLTDIEHLAKTSMTELSGGERQRVFIARALAQEPEILLLDEPNAHLDITHQLDVLHLTRSLSSQRGLTVIAVFHDLNLAAMFSNRILLLSKGRTVALGRPEEVLTQSHLSTVFRTKVTIDKHPFTSSPRVTIIPSLSNTMIPSQRGLT
jgi:iron complex transport system ATP-binding protein